MEVTQKEEASVHLELKLVNVSQIQSRENQASPLLR